MDARTKIKWTELGAAVHAAPTLSLPSFSSSANLDSLEAGYAQPVMHSLFATRAETLLRVPSHCHSTAGDSAQSSDARNLAAFCWDCGAHADREVDVRRASPAQSCYS